MSAPSRFDDSAFFELALDHLCVAGFDGYWKQLSASWSRTLGFTVEELMAHPLIEFVHPDDREATLSARERLKDGAPLRFLTNRYRCKDGSYRWFEWRSVARVDRELVYAIARDITAEKEARAENERLQRQLVLADRMASVGTLAAGVAHEINNPLQYVAGNLEVLAESLSALPRETRVAECLEMIEDARLGCERIRKIVRALMTFARADDERRRPIDLAPVLDLAIEMAAHDLRSRARLVADFGSAPRVEADEARLAQVFINLLVNAAQAIAEGDPNGNEIRIAHATGANGDAVVEVRDTGSGIAPAVLPRVFDPFFTTKAVGVGTGLGLSISHAIVSGLGGTITAENGSPRGAVFRVTLPPA